MRKEHGNHYDNTSDFSISGKQSGAACGYHGYRDLIVRVAGYSDYFRNLDKPLQDEIIERTEQDFGC